MSTDDLVGAQMVEPEPGREPAGGAEGEEGAATRGGFGGLLGSLLGAVEPAGGAGGIDLGGVLGGLLSGAGHAGGAGEPDLGSLLGGLMGRPTAGGLDVNGLAEESGVSPAVIQAAIPLVLGALVQGGRQGAAGVDLAATRGGASPHPAGLAELAGALLSGKPIGPQLLQATGLPQQLAHSTGLDLSHAGTVIQNILRALHIGPGSAGTKPRKKPGQSSASAAAKPKPKPRPSAAGTKPKPKPTAGTARPKPKPAGGKPKNRPSAGRPRAKG